MSEEQADKEKVIEIIYVGKDLSYFRDMKDRFEQFYDEQEFEFRPLYHDHPEELKKILKEVVHSRAKIIFIDYSLDSPEMLRLAYNLRTEWATKDRLVVGLLSSLDSRRYLQNSLAIGVFFHYVKGPEISAIVHNCMATMYPDIVKDIDYAKAQVTFKAMAQTSLQIGFLTDRFMHVETNFKFPMEEEIVLSTNLFMPVPLSNHFKVVREFDSNLYTVFDHAFDLEYVHLASPDIDKAREKLAQCQKELKKDPKSKNWQFEVSSWESQLEAAHNKAKEDAKKRGPALRDWIFENEGKSRPKRTKVLVIDRELNLLNAQEKLDSFGFALRLHSTFDQSGSLLHRTRPGIVAFVLDYAHEKGTYFSEDDLDDSAHAPEETPPVEGQPEEGEAKSDEYALKSEINGIEQLKWMIESIKSQDNYHPFLIIFNSRENQDRMVRELDYQQLLSVKNPISIDALKKVAEAYAEKGGRAITHDKDKSFADKERRLYFSKYDPASIAFYGFNIHVNSLSEAEMTFSAPIEIPHYTYLYIKFPVKMTLTVVPPKSASSSLNLPRGHKPYYALINGLGELEIKNLRKYINDLFFTELSEKRAEEAAEQERLKQEFLQKKEEEEEAEDSEE